MTCARPFAACAEAAGGCHPFLPVPVRLLLIDGNYYVYRSFFAIRDLTNSRGEPTNAIFGFTKAVRKMLKDLSPDLAAVVWDMGMPVRRTALQPQYKQNRAATPDAMRPQAEYLRALVPKLGLHGLGLPDTEADDLIASYVVAARREGIECVVATNDKDILALTASGVQIYSTAKADLPEGRAADFVLLDAAAVEAKWGVPPARIHDVLALTGDSSDNIPGVPGVGAKTAAALVREHGSLDAVLADLTRVKNEKLRAKLEGALMLIGQNREMVRLDDDLPLPKPVLELRVNPDYPAVLAALEECEFRALLTEYRAEAKRGSAPAAFTEIQGELFG